MTLCLIPVMMIGIVMATFDCRTWMGRLLVLALMGPVAFTTECIRIAITEGMYGMSNYWLYESPFGRYVELFAVLFVSTACFLFADRLLAKVLPHQWTRRGPGRGPGPTEDR